MRSVHERVEKILNSVAVSSPLELLVGDFSKMLLFVNGIHKNIALVRSYQRLYRLLKSLIKVSTVFLGAVFVY